MTYISSFLLSAALLITSAMSPEVLPCKKRGFDNSTGQDQNLVSGGGNVIGRIKITDEGGPCCDDFIIIVQPLMMMNPVGLEYRLEGRYVMTCGKDISTGSFRSSFNFEFFQPDFWLIQLGYDNDPDTEDAGITIDCGCELEITWGMALVDPVTGLGTSYSPLETNNGQPLTSKVRCDTVPCK